jgi:hypothetical protein
MFVSGVFFGGYRAGFHQGYEAHAWQQELAEARKREQKRRAMDAKFDELINLITATVAPDTWQDVGGSGEISTFSGNICCSFVVADSEAQARGADDPFSADEADPFAANAPAAAGNRNPTDADGFRIADPFAPAESE